MNFARVEALIIFTNLHRQQYLLSYRFLHNIIFWVTIVENRVVDELRNPTIPETTGVRTNVVRVAYLCISRVIRNINAYVVRLDQVRLHASVV